MDTPVDMPMDVEPADAPPVEEETQTADVEGRTDEAMPTFDVPDTAEELSDDFLAPPPEHAVDPDVAAIFDALAGEEFAPVDAGPVAAAPATRSDIIESAGTTDDAVTTEDAVTTDDAVTTELDPTEATEASAGSESNATADADAPLVDLHDAHDPELVARIDDLLAGFQVKLDELIAELHAE